MRSNFNQETATLEYVAFFRVTFVDVFCFSASRLARLRISSPVTPKWYTNAVPADHILI